MTSVQDWIAYRVGLLFADNRGRIAVGARLRDRAARVGLFLDLVLRDRLLFDDEGSSIDTTPIGFAPADVLLGYIDEHPTGTLYDVFTSAPVTMRDVLTADPALSSRRLGRVTVDPVAAAEQRVQLRSMIAAETFDGPATAILVALADALGLMSVSDMAGLYSRCGPAATVIADCHDYLGQVVEGLKLITGLLNTSSSGS